MEPVKSNILIVDNDGEALEFIGNNLRKAGYKIFLAKEGREAINKARNILPELIIMEAMIPEMDGIETCHEMRLIPELDKTLIIFLTVRAEVYSQIAGLNAGADDYLIKPINPTLLVCKVNSLLRRLKELLPNIPNPVNNLVINYEQYKITYKGKDFVLPKRQFELLQLLSSKPNKVFSRNEIYSKIWSFREPNECKSIDIYIHKIREKLGIDNIKTIKGVGYKYEC